MNSGMRASKRPRNHFIVPLTCMLVLTSGCSSMSPSGKYDVVDGSSDDWWIGVKYPEFGPDTTGDCTDDDMVEGSNLSFDEPSSGSTVWLTASALENDAIRIAQCIDETLTSGEIAIYRPVRSFK